MKTINFAVEDFIYGPFKKQVDSSGMKVSGLFKVFMKTYGSGKLTISDGEIVSTAHVSRETSKESKGPGRPPKKDDSEILGDMSPDVPKSSEYKTIMDYKKVVMRPIERDSSPSLHLDTEDINGKTWLAYIKEDWFSERCKIDDDDDWLDYTLPVLVECWEKKFMVEGKVDYRFRINDDWMEIIELNQELTLLYEKEIDAAIAKRKGTV